MESHGGKLDLAPGELQELEDSGKSKRVDGAICVAADVSEYHSPLEGAGALSPRGRPPHGPAKSLDVRRHASLGDADEHPQEEASADDHPLPRESSQAAAAASDVANSSEATKSTELEDCSFDEPDAALRGAMDNSHVDPRQGNRHSERPASSRLRSEGSPHRSRVIERVERDLTEQDCSQRAPTHSRLHSSSSCATQSRATESGVVRALSKSGRYASNLSLPPSAAHDQGLEETHADRVFAAFHISNETPEINTRRRGSSREGSRRRAATKDLIISALSEQIHHQQRCIQVQESRLFLQERRLHQLERVLGSLRMQQDWAQQRQSREHLWQHLQQKMQHRSSSGTGGLHHVVANQAMHLEATGVSLYPGAQWVDGLVTYFPPRAHDDVCTRVECDSACDAAAAPCDEAPASHRLDITRYLFAAHLALQQHRGESRAWPDRLHSDSLSKRKQG
ncbi:hypothetical protein Emag_001000 [Eimeria magna]